LAKPKKKGTKPLPKGIIEIDFNIEIIGKCG
jgi:hypothetical protein